MKTAGDSSGDPGKDRGVKEGPEIALDSRTGEKIHAIVSSQALFDDRRRHAGTVMVFTDISERKSLERQLLEITIREQQRIGRDLHDDLGQILAGTGFLCESLVRKLTNKGLPEAEEARSIYNLLGNAREHTRMLASGISPFRSRRVSSRRPWSVSPCRCRKSIPCPARWSMIPNL